jgi:hypothetical protein
VFEPVPCFAVTLGALPSQRGTAAHNSSAVGYGLPGGRAPVVGAMRLANLQFTAGYLLSHLSQPGSGFMPLDELSR